MRHALLPVSPRTRFSHRKVSFLLSSRRTICLTVRALTVSLFIPAAHAAESGNTVDINVNPPGTVTGGGFLGYTGDATHNTVNMLIGTVTVSGDIFGGRSDTGNATNNTINMTDGTVNLGLYGGWSNTADTVDNTITLAGGTVLSHVYGGHSVTGNAINNAVNITGGTVSGDLFGGLVVNGDPNTSATGNTVTMTGGKVNGNVNGGNSRDGTAANNTVIITGGTVGMRLVGGRSNAGNSMDNVVTIKGGTVVGDVIGGSSANAGNATNNTVNMTGGVAQDIYGGQAQAGDVANNTVNMSGGTVGFALYGGWSAGGHATNNTVNMTGGTASYIIGGYSNNAGDATHNTVTVADGIVSGDIYAGFAASGNATNNTVNLYGGSIAGGVYGGATAFGGVDVRTGNTLNVHGFQGSVGEVNNFSHYSFLLPATIQNGDTLVHITGAVPTDLAGTTASLNMAGSSSALTPGASVVLIDKVANTSNTTNVTASQGVSLLYDFSLSVDGSNRFIATLKNIQVNPQTEALSEGRITGLALLNQGGDLFATSGIRNARAVTEKEERVIAFSTVSRESLRYNSGSHIDVDSFSMLLGGAMRNNNLLLGSFFEAGWGDYNSDNSFTNAASVEGKGKTSYYGAGIFTRYDWGNTEAAGLYADASLRAGRVKTDFSSDDLVNTAGQAANYDTSAQYYGLHAGLGYELDVSSTSSLDVSTRYLWTHQNGKTVHVLGDPFEFKATDSHRWRTGARLNHTATGSSFTPYVGAYYEHEFSAAAKASVHGLDIDAPNLKGSTGIAELGFAFRPANVKDLSVNVGVQGYTGKREGVSGNVDVKFSF